MVLTHRKRRVRHTLPDVSGLDEREGPPGACSSDPGDRLTRSSTPASPARNSRNDITTGTATQKAYTNAYTWSPATQSPSVTPANQSIPARSNVELRDRHIKWHVETPLFEAPMPGASIALHEPAGI